MAPFRNFLSRKPQPNGGETDGFNENNENNPPSQLQRPGPTPIEVRGSQDGTPPEYKLCVVNDSGVYLPPSPPEKQSFWSRYPGSTRSSHHRDLVDENEPFSISRESFDSYRRSFDISARAPVAYPDAVPSRTSLDSRFCRVTPPAMRSTTFEKPDVMKEEVFEDVGLNDETKPKKKGIFARFGDSSSDAPSSGKSTPRFHIPGRKRGQSGGGSELSSMTKPEPMTTTTSEINGE
ncbi:hypothetical protein N7486_005375 [Penicillium sp. IBT 16267x]|nr:hypothetical protein N7486_005375 [Penicillium sp. IBT 16267x]